MADIVPTAVSHKSKSSVDATSTGVRRPSFKKRTSARPPSSSAALLGVSRAAVQEVVVPPKEMAASFLQYCAMCEKQITTPCNSILYCSEACRRKDSNKPLSAANAMNYLSTPPPSIPSSPTQPVLVPRAPTGTSHIDTPVVRIPCQLHDFKSDLDPTEWKPKLHNRKESEAFRYLSQFHRSTSSISIAGSGVQHGLGPELGGGVPSSVPTPSLVNTPTTTNSSLSTSAGFGYTAGHGIYDFSVRPLPMRPNRWYSADGATPRGTDLVTPHIAPVIVAEDVVAEAGVDLWNKKTVVRGSGGAKEGLGKLFGDV